MTLSVVALPSPEALNEFVLKALCEHDRLDPAQTPLYRTALRRGDRACGVLFHVEGPRLLKNSAVWAETEHRILFYDSNGVRFGEVRLSESPVVQPEEPLPPTPSPKRGGGARGFAVSGDGEGSCSPLPS